jgi:hypothetical protein
MKKLYLLFLAVLFAQCITAQNLAAKIPANANIVASIDAAKLSQMMPTEQFDKTAIGKKLKKMQKKEGGVKYTCAKDFGININSSLYYFHTEDDSMNYHCMIAPLVNAGKLDKILGQKELIRLAGNVRKVIDDDSTGFFMWNEQQLFYVNAVIKDAYFRNTEVAQRHGLSYKNYYDVAVDSAMIMVDSVAAVPDTVTIIEDVVVADTAIAATDAPAVIEEDSVKTEDSGDYHATEADFDYYNDLKIKRTLAGACAAARLNELFNKTPDSSILSNSSYVSSNSASTVAGIWIDRPMNMYLSVIPSYYFYKPGLSSLNKTFPADDFGYKSFSAGLLMDKKQMSIHSQVEMSAEMAEIQQKISARKINSDFYKYINTDSMLGYMTWALDTKAYLEQFPAMMERTYSSMGLGLGSEEYSLAAEFFSFLIDEEAVGKMIKGDAMVLFDGVFKQETTYTDYSYDENYKATEVIKTKTETLPRFLMMMSSEENNLVKKLIKYGLKDSLVKQKAGFYELALPKSPVRFYFMHKNNVFFLTNSLPNIEQISAGTFKSNIAKQEMDFIADHNFTMYMNPKKISSKLSATDLGATESLTDMINLFNKMGVVRMQINPIKNNVTSADLWMDVPKGHNNALTFFFDLFEGILK